MSSYVTKTSDDSIVQRLYDADLDARNAAFRFVVNHKPAEPEIWFYISNFKSCYYSVLTKKLSVSLYPASAMQREQTRTAILRTTRGSKWLNFTTVSKTICHIRFQGSSISTWQACKCQLQAHVYSQLLEFMFQHTMMNIPFSDLTELFPPHFADVPKVLQCYTMAEYCNSALWHDDTSLTEMLRRRGLKNHKIAAYLSFVHALRDTYHLWCHGHINAENLVSRQTSHSIWSRYNTYLLCHRASKKKQVLQTRLACTKLKENLYSLQPVSYEALSCMC